MRRPLLPDLELPSLLVLECVLCLVGDLSRLSESIESVRMTLLPESLPASEERLRLERTFLKPFMEGSDIAGDPCGDGCVDTAAIEGRQKGEGKVR